MAKSVDVNVEALRRQVGAPRNRSDAAKMERKVATRLRRVAKAREHIRKLEQAIVKEDIEAIRLCDALYRFASARRKPGQKKEHLEHAGSLEWLESTRSILTKDEAEIIAKMKQDGLGDFIKVDESIKVDALKQAGKAVDGVEQRTNELFIVRPTGVPLRIERDWQTGKYVRKANDARNVMADVPMAQAAE